MSKKTTLPGLLTISVDALIRALQLLLRQAIGTASTDGWQAVEPIMGLNLGDDVAPDEYYHHYAVVTSSIPTASLKASTSSSSTLRSSHRKLYH